MYEVFTEYTENIFTFFAKKNESAWLNYYVESKECSLTIAPDYMTNFIQTSPISIAGAQSLTYSAQRFNRLIGDYHFHLVCAFDNEPQIKLLVFTTTGLIAMRIEDAMDQQSFLAGLIAHPVDDSYIRAIAGTFNTWPV